MTTLFEHTTADLEHHGTETADLSYWALLAESVQPELNFAQPSIRPVES